MKSQEPTTMEELHRRLRKVMNPLSGLDLERTNLVKNIELKDGEVRVVIDLPEGNQFAPAIKKRFWKR